MTVTEVLVPDIGDFKDVEIIEIPVAVGDQVNEDDPLITLESDKATMEVPSPYHGTVSEIKVAVGERVSEGTLIVTMETGEASVPAPPSPEGHQEADAAPIKAPQAAAPPAGAAAPPPPSDEVHAGPGVRRLARELEIDLDRVVGSGAKGRIVKEDLKAYLAGEAAPGPAAAPAGGAGIPPIPAIDFSQFGATETVALSRIKKLSGAHLQRCWLNVPHVTHQDEADITEIDAYRKEMDTAAKEEGYRVTLLAFLMKACVSALKSLPDVNASLAPDGENLILKQYYHIGIAVDTPGGLVVPVFRDVDRKGIVDLGKEMGAISAKARDGKLAPGDLQGASFTISSLGGIGGIGFTPIVNAPEVAILGVTRAKLAPVWDGEAFQPRLMLPLSLSYDHRVIDGAAAARFTARLAYLLGDVRRLLS